MESEIEILSENTIQCEVFRILSYKFVIQTINITKSKSRLNSGMYSNMFS